MKYGGDKIKIVTDGLKKGDKIEALTFDRCGYLLIGKWNNSYGTKGDPLMSDEVPCGSEGNCPACQEKIDDVIDLPGRPQPCDEGDAILALSKNGKLKSICRSNFEDNDKNVAVSSDDEIAGYLKDKLIVCDDDGPLSFTENEQGSFHTYCIGWDPTKAKMKFIDLTDTPNRYSKPGLLYCDGDGISYLEPKVCDYADYSYLVYNSKNEAWDTMCPRDMSVANRVLNSDYPITVAAGATWSNPVQASADCTLRSTDDIEKGTGSTLFKITRPGVYILTLNSTLLNDIDAWLKAARGGLTINGEELGDAKYCSRDCTKYVNEEYPDTFIDHEGVANELELGIMSFNTSYVYVFSDISKANPANIGFSVKIDCRVGDPRHTGERPPDNAVTCRLTSGTSEEGPRTFISAVRIGDIPKTYALR